MIEHERQDELLDQAEDAQIFVPADLIERAPLRGIEAGRRLGAGKSLRQEVAAEVELGAFGKDLLDLPGRAHRCREDLTEIVIVKHYFCSLAKLGGNDGR